MITCFFAALFLLITSCRKNDDSTSNNNSSTAVPDIYKKIYGAADMYIQGDYVVIKTIALPDHKSPYYKSTQWESTKYEAYNGNNASYFSNNAPIQQQNLSFKIPLNLP